MIKPVLAVAVIAMLSGCSTAPKLITAAGKDPASFTLDINTIYGRVRHVRANPSPGHSATIGADGSLKVEWVGTNTAPLAQPQPVSVIRTPEVDRAIDAFFGTRPPPPKANSAP